MKSGRHEPLTEEERQLQKECTLVRRAVEQWKHIAENGCSDPFWPDGINMELERNHVIAGKMEISRICGENGIPLPEEYFIPTPPEVSSHYMANRKPKDVDQKKRYERILAGENYGFEFRKPEYDERQLSFE